MIYYYIDKKFKARITDIAKIKDDWYIIEITSDTGEIYKISETIDNNNNLSYIINIGDIVNAEIYVDEDHERYRIGISSSKIKQLLGFDGFSGLRFVELINDKWCDYLDKNCVYTPLELRRRFRDSRTMSIT